MFGTPVNISFQVTSQHALPFPLPITKSSPSFLHDCVTYEDVMGLSEGEELTLWKGNGYCVGISCSLDSLDHVSVQDRWSANVNTSSKK